MQLRGKIALVTGGAHRVGRAVTLALAAEGCDLMVHFHRSGEAAAATVADALRLGVQASSVAADLSHTAGIETTFAALDDTFAGLDILVNSAAILEPVALLQASAEDWRRTIDLNLRGATLCLQQAALRMRRRGGGAIVNISDVAGHRPFGRYPLHSISKAGLEMLTKAAALELAPDIRVNAVVPGPVLKPDRMSQGRWRRILQRIPQRRAGAPEDVAQTVVFLLRNEYLTGESLHVDGGSLLV